MTTRNSFTIITSQGNALFQKPLMPLLHLLGLTQLHSTGFCLFSIINEYHLNVGRDIIATPTKVRDIICMQHKQNTTMEDVEVHLLRHPPLTYLTGQSMAYSLLTSHLWLRSLGNTWDKVLPPNGKPTKVSKRHVQKRGIRLSRVLEVQEQILQSYLFSGFALPVSQTQQQSEIFLENAHAHRCVDIYPWSYLKTQILNKKSI